MSLQKENEVQLVHSGNDFFDTMEHIIDSGKHTLHLQTYIFDNDATGRRILDKLKQAAARGVNVNLVLDAFGSKSLSKNFIEEIERSGIIFRWFAPFLSWDAIRVARRLHHKILVVDSKIALIGGINISDKYKGDERTIPWLDYAILIKGNICKEIDKICTQIFDKKFKLDTFKNAINNYKKIDPAIVLQLRQNDRLRGKNEISKSYTRAIRNAKHSITLVSSYFLPGTQIKYALGRAAKRGVKINIILAGISDIPVLNKAAYHLYGSFLKQGISIYEWKRSVLHGKLALVDDKWVTIGSFNLNHLSALSSIELNVDVRDEAFIYDLKEHLQTVVNTGCEKIDYTIYIKNNTFIKRSINLIAYFLSRTCMRFLALFPKLFSSSREESGL
ncbi:MAG: phospholipase D-like domain-containing protein [Bacteroidota bacterium]